LLYGGKILTDFEAKTGDIVPHNNNTNKKDAITKQVILFNISSQFSNSDTKRLCLALCFLPNIIKFAHRS
jgi:hypothetical protein